MAKLDVARSIYYVERGSYNDIYLFQSLFSYFSDVEVKAKSHNLFIA